MSVSYSSVQPQQQTRKGLAIASLVLGVISIPTLGLLVVGAITGIVISSFAKTGSFTSSNRRLLAW